MNVCWPAVLSARNYGLIILGLTLSVVPSFAMADRALMIADQSDHYQAFLLNLRESAAGTERSRYPLLSYFIDPLAHRAPIYELTIDNQSHAVTVLNSPTTDDVSGNLASNPTLSETDAFSDLCERAAVAVTVGPDSATTATQHCAKPLLFTLLLRHRADQLLGPNPTDQSAIYLEADPALNLKLIHQALPEATTVGVLVSSATEHLIPRLSTAATDYGLTLKTLRAQDDRSAVSQLREAITSLEAILLLPEIELVNDWSLQPLLLMAARHQVPVFGGLTPQYVSAGVTAAVLPDIDQLKRQIQSTADQLAQGHTPLPAYPAATIVVVNKLMARSYALQPETLTLDE